MSLLQYQTLKYSLCIRECAYNSVLVIEGSWYLKQNRRIKLSNQSVTLWSVSVWQNYIQSMSDDVITFYPQCSLIPPVYHLIHQTDASQPTKLMILGTTCSISSILMGQIAQKNLNLPQVRPVVIVVFSNDAVHDI